MNTLGKRMPALGGQEIISAGPEFEDPTRSGCRRYQQPLQASRLPAGIL